MIFIENQWAAYASGEAGSICGLDMVRRPYALLTSARVLGKQPGRRSHGHKVGWACLAHKPGRTLVPAKESCPLKHHAATVQRSWSASGHPPGQGIWVGVPSPRVELVFWGRSLLAMQENPFPKTPEDISSCFPSGFLSLPLFLSMCSSFCFKQYGTEPLTSLGATLKYLSPSVAEREPYYLHPTLQSHAT